MLEFFRKWIESMQRRRGKRKLQSLQEENDAVRTEITNTLLEMLTLPVDVSRKQFTKLKWEMMMKPDHFCPDTVRNILWFSKINETIAEVCSTQDETPTLEELNELIYNEDIFQQVEEEFLVLTK